MQDSCEEHIICKNNGGKFVVLIALIAVCVSLSFCWAVSDGTNLAPGGDLDPDGYGRLGLNIWKGAGFAVNEKEGPIIHRPPGYPLFIALALFLSGGWYPGAVWVLQSLLLGAIAALAFVCARRLLGRSGGILAGVGCSLSPGLFWYGGRMWNEILLAFFFLLLFRLLLDISFGHITLKCVGVGLILGILAVTKGVFLPFIVIVPVLLFMTGAGIGMGRTLIIPVVALSLLIPWSVRNYRLSGEIVPVHTRLFFNLEVGNIYATYIMTSPFSYGRIWSRFVSPMAFRVSESVSSGIRGEIEKEHIYKEKSLREILSNPFFIVKKAFVSGLMFWGMGDTPAKTLLNLLVRIPVLIFATLGVFGVLKTNPEETWMGIILVLSYWGFHLPFGAPARVSTPILPILFVFASAGVLRLWHRFFQREKRNRTGNPSR